MIVLLLTFLLQSGIITSTESYNDLSAGEQQEYLSTYQAQIIIEDLEGM